MKNVLVIGLGRFGRHMARKLIEEGNEVLAVECNEERQTPVWKSFRIFRLGMLPMNDLCTVWAWIILICV